MICDLKEDTVRNWFNNHRSSNKIKQEVKEEIHIKESNSPELSINSQVNQITESKVTIVNPNTFNVLPSLSDCLNESSSKVGEFSVDLHNFETVDLGYLLAK